MSDSSSNHAESLTSEENWLLSEWRENNQVGLTNYVIITADRFQRGKTSCAMRLAEVREEEDGIPFTLDWDPNHPTDFSNCNLGFDPLWYLDRMDNVPEFTPLIGDEWNRAVGNRKWHDPANQEYAEVLQTTAYQHIDGLFPLPRQKLMDNAIAEVCTAHIIVETQGTATVYLYDWDQLNRQTKARTPRLGELTFKKPSAKKWHTYLKMRDAYTSARKSKVKAHIKEAIERTLEAEAADVVRKEDLLETIVGNPTSYKGKSGRVSAIKIVALHKGLPWNKAQVIASQANERLSKADSN